MVKELDPAQTKRAAAFDAWMKAPLPMVTMLKTLNVTNLVRISRQKHYKFTMLLCWCIGKAASQCEDFYLLPVADRLMQYDALALSVVVRTKDGGISTCDIPFRADLNEFNAEYLRLTARVHDTGEPSDLSADHMVIGTSSLAQYEIDGVMNIYAGVYNNPFLIWGKYRRRVWSRLLPVSFQFHHTQMDGVPAARFLDCLQREIRALRG